MRRPDGTLVHGAVGEGPHGASATRRYRRKRDFDEIDHAEFREAAFATIREHFEREIGELTSLGGRAGTLHSAIGIVVQLHGSQQGAGITGPHTSQCANGGNDRVGVGDISYSFQEKQRTRARERLSQYRPRRIRALPKANHDDVRTRSGPTHTAGGGRDDLGKLHRTGRDLVLLRGPLAANGFNESGETWGSLHRRRSEHGKPKARSHSGPRLRCCGHAVDLGLPENVAEGMIGNRLGEHRQPAAHCLENTPSPNVRPHRGPRT